MSAARREETGQGLAGRTSVGARLREQRWLRAVAPAFGHGRCRRTGDGGCRRHERPRNCLQGCRAKTASATAPAAPPTRWRRQRDANAAGELSPLS
mmetsp:Transcript_15678/g.39533  ORF Transcript_15678/g.39533 Transcript_15678/m.39533 type:complete len:96 (-) Transcript_15678:140-427(-)